MTDVWKATLAFAAVCIVATGAGCATPRTDSGSAFGTPTSSTTALSTKLRGTDSELAVVGKGFSVTASRLSGTGQADLGAGIVLAVPPTAAEPKVTPQQAFDALVAGGNANQPRFALSPPMVELTLFSNLQTGHIRADGTVKLFWTGVLAWAFLYTDYFPQRNAPVQRGNPSPPATAKMTEMNVLVVVDASTGISLIEEVGINLTPQK